MSFERLNREFMAARKAGKQHETARLAKEILALVNELDKSWKLRAEREFGERR